MPVARRPLPAARWSCARARRPFPVLIGPRRRDRDQSIIAWTPRRGSRNGKSATGNRPWRST